MVWSSNWDEGGWQGAGGGGGGGWQSSSPAKGGWGPAPRQRLGLNAVGILVEWQQKGPKSFGWISPIYGIPEHLPEAQSHGGDVYVNAMDISDPRRGSVISFSLYITGQGLGTEDISDPRPGSVISFSLYIDGQGLGAEECVSRSVLRFTMPMGSKAQLTLPMVEVNPCVAYLKSSVFYPELEDRGVTLRKYMWESPLTVFELWGSVQDILRAAEEIGLLAHPEVEVLTSRKMAKSIDPDLLRDISEQELPGVPPRFRVGFRLLGAAGTSAGPEEVRARLVALLGQ